MIGLATIHHANSYGGLLQAYATVQRLSQHDDVHVLDYRKPALSDGLRPIRWSAREPRDVLRIGKDVLRYPARVTLIRKFNDFIETKFPLTRRFSSVEEASRVVNEAGITHLVAGSDQIWNPSVTGGFDQIFTLGMEGGAIRSSLSSSAGSYRYAGKEAESLRRALDRFDHIAVREPDFADYVRSILPDRDVAVTLDPTLLLEKKQWQNLADVPNPSPYERYILTYTLGAPDGIDALVADQQKGPNLPVVGINQDPFLRHKADLHLKSAGPQEFLALVQGAEAVITNSFHGAAFSIIFEKPFLVVPPPSGLNRISGLLGRLGIVDRIRDHTPPERGVREKSEIDYGRVTPGLHMLRSESNRYLSQAFSKKNV